MTRGQIAELAVEIFAGTAGLFLLADALGFKVAAAFFLIAWSMNLRGVRIARDVAGALAQVHAAHVPRKERGP
jgi:hypothetical protein